MKGEKIMYRLRLAVNNIITILAVINVLFAFTPLISVIMYVCILMLNCVAFIGDGILKDSTEIGYHKFISAAYLFCLARTIILDFI